MEIIEKRFSQIKQMPVAVKAAFVYMFATVINRGLHFITTPIFTRIMTVKEMGVVSNYSTWTSFISTVATLGTLTAVLNVALVEYKDDRKGYLKSSQTVATLGTLITATIIFLFFPYFHNILGMSREYALLMFVHIVFSAASSLWVAWQRYEYRYIAIGVYTILSSLIDVLVSVICVVVAKHRGYPDLAYIRIYAAFFGKLIIWVPIYLYFLFLKNPLLKPEYVKFSLTMGIPMIGHSFSKTILSVADRVMIRMYSGEEALGYYSVLYNLSILASIVWDALMSALVPYIYERIDGNEKEKHDVKVITWQILLIYAVCCCLVILFAPEIVRIIVSEKYLNTVYIMPPIAAGIFYIALYQLYAQIILVEKKSKVIMYATMTAAIFNVIANYVLIPIFDYVAAAYTTLLSYILLSAIYIAISKKMRKQAVYFDKRIVVLSVVIAVFSVFCSYLYFNDFIRYFFIGVFMIALMIYRKGIEQTLKTIRGNKIR